MSTKKESVENNAGLTKAKEETSGTNIKIKYITGNLYKLKKAIQIFETGKKVPVIFDDIKLNLPKLKGTPIRVAKEKCRMAARKVKGPVLVEVNSLHYNALNGLPGIGARRFLKAIGLNGLNNLLAAYEDKSASAQCILAFCRGVGHEPILFIGEVDGQIVSSRGPEDSGWDSIFQPRNCEKTLAELGRCEYHLKPKHIALIVLKNYFENTSPENMEEMIKETANIDTAIGEVEINQVEEKTSEKKTMRKRARENEGEGNDEELDEKVRMQIPRNE